MANLPLNLTPVHIKHKKQIGKVNTNPVWEIATTGGLFINVLGKGAGFEVIGTGPHPAVARHISEQKQPSVEWSDLSKAEWVDPAHFEFILPKYIAITDALVERQKENEHGH